MNTAEYVANLITDLKAKGTEKQNIAWQAALACVGWAYVFGARGQYCTPANRRARYSDDHPTIKTACKNYNGSGSSGCAGCKWYPTDKYTRFFDCRGFTYWILKSVYDGWELMGTGATAQWNTASNWKAKGTIDTMPKDTLCCLFVQKGKTMEHTGFGLNNETIECSSGVQHFTSRKAKWTHWGVPAVVEGSVTPTPKPTPDPSSDLPTLRRGSKGEYVTLLQTKLVSKGYSVGSAGIDGDFGSGTLAAVKAFQKDHGLTVDGVVGKNTWKALMEQETSLYTVTIPHLTKYKAEALIKDYAGSSMIEERG